MGSNKSVLQDMGYTVMSEQDGKILVKDKGGDQFVIKKLSANKNNASEFIEKLSHPHIVEHKDIITDHDCLYLMMEHCEGGDLAQKIKDKKEGKVNFFVKKTTGQREGVNAVEQRLIQQEMEYNQILNWTVKICMALKHLHDQQILHKNLTPKSIFFTASGTIRLGEFGEIDEWFTNAQTAETTAYNAPEKSNPDDEKSEVWSLGRIINEMYMCACKESSTTKNNCSYEALPEDLRQLVKDTLQRNPDKRPSVSEILMRPFIIKHLHQMSTRTIEELNESLNVLEELASSLEKVHYNTTVGSLTGGVVGLAGGITSIVGIALAPVTFGASLIVTGVGIGTAVAGGITAGASNITKMVNQRSNRQNIKMIITELQEKITSTCCCIQNIQIAVETRKVLSMSSAKSGADAWANAGFRLGRGLGGIAEIVRLAQVASIGKTAAQAARVVRVAEVASGVLSGLFVAVDIFFIALDSREIHRLRRDYASLNNNVEELRSEIMKFVTKIRNTKEEVKKILDELKVELQALGPEIPNY